MLSPKDDAAAKPALTHFRNRKIEACNKVHVSAGRTRTNLAVLCTIALIEGVDIQLLPGSLRALEADLGISPKRLAALTLIQGCAGALAGPLWASLADNGFSRRKLLSFGVAAWGMVALLLARAEAFNTMMLLRGLNGMALGMMVPVTQSLVSDVSDKSEIGFMFGCLQFYTNFGQVFGAIAVTSVATHIFGNTQGWRIAYGLVGVASISAALCVHAVLVEEPRLWTPERTGVRQELRKFFGYLHIRSFMVVVIQGIFGMIPWAAMAFAPIFFQYVGYSDAMASLIYGTIMMGSALGGLFGGVLGDRFAALSPFHGRVATAQISITLGIPLVLLIFVWVPTSSPPVIYAMLCFGLGLVGSWSSSACNRPIFAEMVPSGSCASALAWEVALESTCGFFLGPAAVGLLAEETFGFKMNTLQVIQMSTDARLASAKALGRGVVALTVVPWVLCVLCYGFLHRTLPQDVAAVSLGPDLSDLDGRSSAKFSEAVPFAKLVHGGGKALEEHSV